MREILAAKSFEDNLKQFGLIISAGWGFYARGTDPVWFLNCIS